MNTVKKLALGLLAVALVDFNLEAASISPAERVKYRYLKSKMDALPPKKGLLRKMPEYLLHMGIAGGCGLLATAGTHLVLGDPGAQEREKQRQGLCQALKEFQGLVDAKKRYFEGIRKRVHVRAGITSNVTVEPSSWLAESRLTNSQNQSKNNDAHPACPSKLPERSWKVRGLVRASKGTVKNIYLNRRNTLIFTLTSVVTFLILRRYYYWEPTPFKTTFEVFIAQWPQHKPFVPDAFYQEFDEMYEGYVQNGSKLPFDEELASRKMQFIDLKILDALYRA